MVSGNNNILKLWNDSNGELLTKQQLPLRGTLRGRLGTQLKGGLKIDDKF